jgi:hypothetical protein
MVPVAAHLVSRLPTSVTGKVDRSAPARAHGHRPSAGRPPRTDRELHVCQIWAAVLAKPVADVEANFVELGGHPLLAARAVAALRKATGLRVSIRLLLANHTPVSLASELDRLAAASHDQLPVDR